MKDSTQPRGAQESADDGSRVVRFAGGLGRPVTRERVSDTVATKLTELIANGTLLPSMVLPNETELAHQFGVGKSAIREAVKIVSTRGMLSVHQGYGTVVNGREQWNLQDPGVIRAMRTQLTLEQLLEVRRILEPEMAALAARRASPADIERLRERATPPDETGYEWHHAIEGLTFHEAVAEAAQNPVLGIVFSSLRVLAESKVLSEETPDSADDGRQPPRPEPRMEIDHRSILEAIEQGDEELARARVRAHLDGLTPYWKWVSHEKD